jgi:ribosome-associated protein
LQTSLQKPVRSTKLWRCLLEGSELAHLLVESILDKKGESILLLDIRDQAIFTDFFLLANADSSRQLQAMADGLLETAKKKADTLPWGVEGEPESGWMLVDFGDVVVHLFDPEKREYYNLEDLWREARVVVRMQ